MAIDRARWVNIAGVVAITAVLGGCAAVHTSIAKKDLDVQTKMSDTIFLDPSARNSGLFI